MKFNRISKLLDAAGDRFEAAAGSVVGRVAFVLWCALAPRFSADVANYAISVYTAAILVFTIPASRRSLKALHAKVDDLEDAIEEADSRNVRLEERDEAEIEACRK